MSDKKPEKKPEAKRPISRWLQVPKPVDVRRIAMGGRIASQVRLRAVLEKLEENDTEEALQLLNELIGNAHLQPFSEFSANTLFERLPRKTKEDLDRIRELAVLTDEEKAPALSWHNFTEAAYQALLKSLPENMNGLAVITYLPFIDAIVNSSTTRPEELEQESNGAAKEPASDEPRYAAEA